MKSSATMATRTLWVCAFLAAVPADASPFSVAVPQSAERESAITVSLLFDGSVSDLEAADFWLRFDARVFDADSPVYRDFPPALGSATRGGFSLLAGIPHAVSGSLDLLQVDFSLASLSDPVDQAGSLVDVSFLIKPNAPLGLSGLVFESQPQPYSDYEIPATSGSVTVTPAGGVVPEPVSPMLVGIGVLAVAGFRRWLTGKARASE